ncbi:unnamed protein product [Camellia sinensis]
MGWCRTQRQSGRRRWSLPRVDWGLVFSGGIRESLEDQLLSSRVIGAHRTTSGIVHSIDIHPSRKHTCIAGGSSGTVFAWDLRWQQQPIVLSGVAAGEFQSYSLSESEIWEVQYDSYSSNIGNMSTSRVLPVMICSEDGILAVVEQGEEPIELLAEPCAINSFDIDQQNPSGVICSLEWEAIAILMRA